MKNEKTNEDKKIEDNVKKSNVITRVQILKSDLELLGLTEQNTNAEIRNKVREILKLPKIQKNTKLTQVKTKLGLPANAKNKDIIEALLKQ